jgi:hypothetical protein
LPSVLTGGNIKSHCRKEQEANPSMPQSAGGFSPILILAVGFNRRKNSKNTTHAEKHSKYTTHAVLQSPKTRPTFAPKFKTQKQANNK